ncbi:hypothetical protein ES703_106653 [subsurface metagenome]
MPKLPGVNHLNAVRALEKTGFWIARQGKHIVMTDGSRILTIPRHNPINAITMGNIVRDACFLLFLFLAELSECSEVYKFWSIRVYRG